MLLIMVFIFTQLHLPGQGCLRFIQRAESCPEAVDVGNAGCAIAEEDNSDGHRDGLAMGRPPDAVSDEPLETDGKTDTESVVPNGERLIGKPDSTTTAEKKTSHLKTNRTTVVHRVKSVVRNLINTGKVSREDRGLLRGKKRKRPRLIRKHSRKDEKRKMIHEHAVSSLVEEYNANCGNENGDDVLYCNGILQQLEREMEPPIQHKSRKPRFILEPKFLCGTIVPLRINWYNPITQICCNGIHNRTSEDETCCGNVVVNQTSTLGCCGVETYNTETSICCKDTLHHNTTLTMRCCGSKTYDTSTSQRCCDGQLYDSERQFCCDNKTLYDNIGKRNNHGDCCGNEMFDSRCYACNVTSSSPTIYPIFNPETQRCCEGRVRTTRQNRTECCGKRLIDPRLSHCVNSSSQLVSDPTTLIQTGIKPILTQSSTKSLVPVTGVLDTRDTNFEEDNPKTPTPTLPLLQIILISLGVICIIAVPASIVVYRKRCQKRTREECIRCDIDRCTSNMNKLSISNDINECVLAVPTNTQDILQPLQAEITNPSPAKLEIDSTNLEKYSGIDIVNLSRGLSNDAETQTFETKRSNVRDTFGNIYQHNCYLDRFIRTLTWDRSDCKMTLPESAVEYHKVEAHASSFDNLPSIYEKFSLPPETRLVSPVVEYRLPGMKTLDNFALVELPFIGKPDCIEVWKCPSDEGMYQTTECRSVPILETADTEKHLWCVIENGKVRVYTKSFSVFFCTCKEQPSNLFLRALLFGSYKKILDSKEVRLSLYLADELHKFKDYNQRMYEIEFRAEREQKCDREILLHEQLTAHDYLEISMAVGGNHPAKWDHKLHPKTGLPLEDNKKKVSVSQLAQCCNSLRSLPYQVSWYLENKPNTIPEDTVQCLVDINCCLANEQSPPINTPLYVDELQLRAKDREQIPSEEDRAADLKDFLNSHLDEEGKARLNEELKRRNKLRRHNGECPDLCKSLDCLFMEMYPTAFTRTIAFVLDDMKFDNIIEQLLERKYISKAHLNRPIQACSDDASNHIVQGFEDRSLSPQHHVLAEGGQSQNLSVQPLQATECRRELEETIITSFDERNTIQQEREASGSVESEGNLVQEPLNEVHLENSNNESDTELKQIVTCL